MYKEMGKKFTCEDLALQILIDFASQNELPLEIHKDNNRKYLDVLTEEQITRFNDITKKTRSQFGYIS